jgi:hypothetical protein
LILVAGVLTSCDSGSTIHSDSIEVQVSAEGDLLVAVCEQVHVGSGYADVKSEGKGEWATFWEAQGEAVIEAGTVGRFGDSPFGMDATRDDPPVVLAGDVIAVQLVPSDGALDAYSVIEIEDPAAVTGKWVNSRGEVSVTPCGMTGPSPG